MEVADGKLVIGAAGRLVIGAGDTKVDCGAEVYVTGVVVTGEAIGADTNCVAGCV